MSLKATWIITCNGCGKTKKNTIELDKDTITDHYTSWFDIWGPGIPHGWIQTVENNQHLFFHNDKCYEEWLRSQGRNDEADRFKNSVWIA